MNLQPDNFELGDRDDTPIDDWTLDEFDELDRATELYAVRSSIAERHAFDD